MGYIPTLLQGAAMTLMVTAASALIAVALAFLVGLARLSRRRSVRGVATIYVEIFRGTSALVQIYFIFFVLPLVGLNLPAFVAGSLALGLNVGAYGSEVVRAAILSVDRGQTEAAIALNMSSWQRLRRIVLPQAVIMMLPSFGNLLIELLKGTSLLSLITIAELSFKGRVLLQTTGNAAVIYTLVLLIYFAMALPLAVAVRRFEGHLSRHRGPARP